MLIRPFGNEFTLLSCAMKSVRIKSLNGSPSNVGGMDYKKDRSFLDALNGEMRLNLSLKYC